MMNERNGTIGGRAIAAAALSALAIAATPPHASAQESDPLPRMIMEFSFLYANPVGDFRDQIDHGIGFNAGLRVPVGDQRRLSLRFDVTGLTYGRESNDVCMRPGAGCRVRANEVTTNEILTFSVGPEFTLMDGPIQPYVHALAGGSIYYTQSGIGGPFSFLPHFGFVTTTNQHDAAFTWGAGGGLRATVPIGAWFMQFSAGARFQRSGEVDYLRKGDISDEPDGTLVLDLQRGLTDLVSFHIGAALAVPTPWARR